VLVDQHDPQLVWGSSSALSGADSILSSQFLLDDHHDPLSGLGLQGNWLDNIHIPGGDHAGVGKVNSSEFGVNFDASAASAIDSVDLGIDWSQLSADLVDSHNSSLNALHTHGDFISQNISPEFSLNPSPIFNMSLSDNSLSDVSLSPSDYVDPILFPPTPLTANTTPMLGANNYSPLLHGGPKPRKAPGPKKRKGLEVEEEEDPDVILKRQRNNVAARKYRQKRIDRIDELEAEVEDIKKERDELRLQLARQEAETAALKMMLQMKNGQGGKE